MKSKTIRLICPEHGLIKTYHLPIFGKYDTSRKVMFCPYCGKRLQRLSDTHDIPAFYEAHDDEYFNRKLYHHTGDLVKDEKDWLEYE